MIGGSSFIRPLAARPQAFIQGYCTHVRGSHVGQPLKLAAWQRDLVTDLFASLMADGRRRHQVLWLDAPRKSGKTTFAAALTLYMLLADEEEGAEIAIASSSIRSASTCFNIVRGMVLNNASMAAACTVRSTTISYKNNYIRVVPAAPRSLDGMDFSMVVIDDVQNVLQSDLHETLRCCMAARRNPLILYLASAGVDQSSLGWKLHCYALSVRTGKIEDPSWLVRMFGAEARDDWTDPEVWKKAHPGIGITISESFVREECIRALGAPGNVDAFRRSCLNVWASQTQRWIDLDKWDLCQQNINWDLYNGRARRIGLDLSATRDLTAIVVAFLETDDNYSLLPFAFCPEEAIDQRGHGDGADYRDWINRGFLTATGGNVVDYAAVQQKVLELRRRYDVLEVLYDKWCASMLVGSLLDGGVACVPIRQDAGFMNSAVRELEQAVDEKRLRHDGNPILRWCVSNACLKANAAGEVRLTKRRSRERIDLAVASLFAFSGFLDNRNRHSFSRFDGARGDAR